MEQLIIGGIIGAVIVYLYIRGERCSKRKQHNKHVAATYTRFANEMLSIGDLDRAEFWHEQAIKKYYEV